MLKINELNAAEELGREEQLELTGGLSYLYSGFMSKTDSANALTSGDLRSTSDLVYYRSFALHSSWLSS